MRMKESDSRQEQVEATAGRSEVKQWETGAKMNMVCTSTDTSARVVLIWRSVLSVIKIKERLHEEGINQFVEARGHH